jgi:2'-5' RNA ligase
MSSPAPIAPPAEVQRLFFALWPSAAVRAQLEARCKPLWRNGGGKAVAVENLHVTLVFLGAVIAEQRACVERAADAIHLPRFSLRLDQVGYWSRPRVMWLGAVEQPPAAVTLADALIAGVRACGLSTDDRPFQTHLTFMRKVAKRPTELAVEPLAWEVDSFALVQSQTFSEGVQYTPLRSWPLQ